MRSVVALGPLLRHVETRAPDPLPTSPLYWARFQSTRGGIVSVTVAGVELAASELAGALASSGPSRTAGWRPAFHALTIACDTLRVDTPLRLPECAVSIHARRVLFGPEGALDTTPLPWAERRARGAAEMPRIEEDGAPVQPGESGQKGPDAGAIRVFAREIVVEGEVRPVLVARGGDGQDAGEGAKGRDGKDVLDATGAILTPIREATFKLELFAGSDPTIHATFDPPATSYGAKMGTRRDGPFEHHGGSAEKPGDGRPAQPPGAPGEPGAGGVVTSNLRVNLLVDNRGGRAGAPGSPVPGGRPGKPEAWAHYGVTCPYVSYMGANMATPGSREIWLIDSGRATPGRDAEPTYARSLEGESPAPRLVASATWLHPLALERVLEYVRDVYLAGNRPEAARLLVEYQDALGDKPPADEAWHADALATWAAARLELATMKQRMEANLDYFGNPAGHAPWMSLVASMTRYQQESEGALRAIILSNWIQKTADGQAKADAIVADQLEQLGKDDERLARAVREHREKAIALAGRFEALAKDAKSVERLLDELERDARVRMLHDKEQQRRFEGLISVGKALLSVVPVGQPALGLAGNALGTLVQEMAAPRAPGADGDAGLAFFDALESSTRGLVKGLETGAKDDSGAAKRKKDLADALAGDDKAQEARQKALEEVEKAGREHDAKAAAVARLKKDLEEATATAEKTRAQANDEATRKVALEEEGKVKALDAARTKSEGEAEEARQRVVALRARTTTAERAAELAKHMLDHQTRANTLVDLAEGAGSVATVLTEVSKAVHRMKVPASEVDIEIAKLKADGSGELRRIGQLLAELTAKKASALDDLHATIDAIGTSYAELTANAGKRAALELDRTKRIGELDPVTLFFIRGLEQRAQHRLIASLYDVAKSFEATTLKPFPAPWDLSRLLSRLNENLEKHPGLDKNDAVPNYTERLRMLQPVLAEILADVREKLAAEARPGLLDDHEALDLTETSHPTVFALLNDDSGGEARVTLDPLSHEGLVKPDRELHRLIDVTLDAEGLKFSGPVPTSGQLELTLEIGPRGIFRKGDTLFGVHRSEPTRWRWTYHFWSGKLMASTESEAEMAKIESVVFGSSASADPSAPKGRRARLVASPPMWSDMTLKRRFESLRWPDAAPGRFPRLTEVHFLLKVCAPDLLEARATRVLHVRCNTPRAVISCEPQGGQPQQGSQIYACYEKGSKVALTARVEPGGPRFIGWEEETRGTDELDAAADDPLHRIELTLGRDRRILCRFEDQREAKEDHP